MARENDLNRLYTLLTALKDQVGGKQRLGNCTGYMNWPDLDDAIELMNPANVEQFNTSVLGVEYQSSVEGF